MSRFLSSLKLSLVCLIKTGHLRKNLSTFSRVPPTLNSGSRRDFRINDHGYIPLVVNTSRSIPHLWFITGFATRVTRPVLLVEQELPTLPEHLSSTRVFNWVRVARGGGKQEYMEIWTSRWPIVTYIYTLSLIATNVSFLSSLKLSLVCLCLATKM
jgi:hypothetical protein